MAGKMGTQHSGAGKSVIQDAGRCQIEATVGWTQRKATRLKISSAAVGLKVEARADGLWRIEHVLADLRSDRLQSVRKLGKPDASYCKATFLDEETEAPYRLHLFEVRIRGQTTKGEQQTLHGELVAVREELSGPTTGARRFSMVPADRLLDLPPHPDPPAALFAEP
jgi:hypothetical protein